MDHIKRNVVRFKNPASFRKVNISAGHASYYMFIVNLKQADFNWSRFNVSKMRNLIYDCLHWKKIYKYFIKRVLIEFILIMVHRQPLSILLIWSLNNWNLCNIMKYKQPGYNFLLCYLIWQFRWFCQWNNSELKSGMDDPRNASEVQPCTRHEE